MISLAGLNDPQRSAAELIEGPILILAGAGSGKTRTITYRIAHMVSNLEIPSKNILAVSFTNKAAKEMRERVEALVGKQKARKMALLTFHSLGVRILKNEIHHLGYSKKFTIYDTTDQLAIIREGLKTYKAGKNFDRKVIQAKISFLKNKDIGPDEYIGTEYFDPISPYDEATEYIYHYYQERLKFYSAIDFDDILYLSVKLFREFPEIAKKYSELYQYIMVDEYQDTNRLQFDFIMALTKTHNNICVVGDDDQSIYAFRGADVSNILDFEKNFPGAKVIKLEQNYRSTTPILDLANEIIKQNKVRREKTLWSEKPSEVRPVIWKAGNADHEAQIVVEDIFNFQKAGGHLGDIAILYRSNTQAPAFEELLRQFVIPYKILGGQKLYEKKEVKDLMGYLSFIHNPKDELAFRRVLNTPQRGIGLKTLEKILNFAHENKLHLIETLERAEEYVPEKAKVLHQFVELIKDFQNIFENAELESALRQLVERINFDEYLQKIYDLAKQLDRRRNDVEQFIQSAKRFEEYVGRKVTLREFVEKIVLQDSQDNQKEKDSEEDEDIRANEVTLMTLHSSKGLEFKKVYLVGTEEEFLPHKKTISEGQDLSEELRLFYVGVTRAQEELIMTYCGERNLYGKDVPRLRTRFLRDLGDYFKEVDRNDLSLLEEEERKEYTKGFFSNLLDNLK
ncbi:MAG: ATP-dependent helicase [Bacteriovoracaceae bacterium]